MFDYSALYSSLQQQGYADLSEHLQAKVGEYFANVKNGDAPAWLQALEDLPELRSKQNDFGLDVPSIGSSSSDKDDLTEVDRSKLIECLKAMMPWRKGPFEVFGVLIDSEWQCQLKWQRLAKYVNLQDKRVLDVGCGNGYYILRMLGAGAKQVLGIDPMLRFVFQFEALKKYFGQTLAPEVANILPLSMQEMPAIDSGVNVGFDVTFSMGVLYHRRDPIDHIMHLKSTLAEGGELILETLIIEEGAEWGDLLEPAKDKSRDKRYAKMNNVWNVPTVALLQQWIKDSGFASSEVCDISTTNFEEQRQSEWMVFHSLENFMHPDNKDLTIEGYPGPRRVLLRCKV